MSKGSVYRRGNSWYADVTLGGLRINRKFGDTESEAKRNLDDLKRAYRRGRLHLDQLTDTGVTVNYAAEEYRNFIRGSAYKTREMFQNAWDVHLKPVYQHVMIHDIRTPDLLDFLAAKRAEKKANRSINIYLGILKKIINHAVDIGLCNKPDLKWPHLKEPKKDHAFLNPEEYEKLINAYVKPNATNKITYLALFRAAFGRETGMRPGELAYLSWPDIDLVMKTAKITSKPDHGWTIKTAEERSIPLNAAAIAILERVKQISGKVWVFSRTTKPVKSIRGALKTAADNAGIKKITPNMLRHTFAVHALMQGTDVRAVAAVMGHTRLETIDTYAHIAAGNTRHAVETLPQIPLPSVPTKPRHRLKVKKRNKQ